MNPERYREILNSIKHYYFADDAKSVRQSFRAPMSPYSVRRKLHLLDVEVFQIELLELEFIVRRKMTPICLMMRAAKVERVVLLLH